MQATGTLRDRRAANGVWLWVVALIAGMLLAGTGGYLVRGSSTNAGAPTHTQQTAEPAVHPAQPIDGLQP